MSDTKNCIKIPTTLLFGVASIALLLASSSAPVHAKALAKVNGVEITDEDLKLAMDDLGPGIPRQLEGKARESYVLDFLIDEQLVVQKAQADKLSETPDFAKKLAYLRDKALMETLLSNIAKSAATEPAIKLAYDEAAKNQKPDTEYHAHHILLPTEEEAKAGKGRRGF
jgi:peptidyl-prolyl cis-trans isomerase C